MGTNIRIAPQEHLAKSRADVEFLREAARALAQELMAIEVSRQ